MADALGSRRSLPQILRRHEALATLARLTGRAFRRHWPELGFSTIALVGAVFAFIGLGSSSYWTDELFTLFVADHHGGWAETLRRALTDTHPPAYYLLLNPWITAFGDAEWVVRLPSALCAVGAVALFWIGARRLFSPAAIAFAAAIAVTSKFWFFQSQNARNYSLCLLLVSGMFAAVAWLQHRRRSGASVIPPTIVLALAGVVLSFCHFYGLLATGAFYAILILTSRDRKVAIILSITGAAILSAELTYIHFLTTHTQENFNELWFPRTPARLIGAVGGLFRGATAVNAWPMLVAMAAIVALRAILPARYLPGEKTSAAANSAAASSLAVILFVEFAGVAISLLYVPSLSTQNMLILSPMVWLLAAWLYDAAMPLLPPLARTLGVAVLILLAASELFIVQLRFVEQNEPWRASAAYVEGAPGCSDAPIPILRPYKFGPNTPFYRDFTQTYLFGRYFKRPDRLLVRDTADFVLPGEDPALMQMLGARLSGQDHCPILAWGLHSFTLKGARALQTGIARVLNIAPEQIRIKTFSYARARFPGRRQAFSGFVLERVK